MCVGTDCNQRSYLPYNNPVNTQRSQCPVQQQAAAEESADPTPGGVDEHGVAWNAKVLLLCGVPHGSLGELHMGAAEGGAHLHNLLKCVAIKTDRNGVKSGLACLGGPWDPELDGGSPAAYVCLLLDRVHSLPSFIDV